MEVSIMTDLVKRQLAQSIATMTRVLRDESIHDAVVAAAHLTADAMKSASPVPTIPSRRNSVAAASMMRCRVSAVSFLDFLIFDHLDYA